MKINKDEVLGVYVGDKLYCMKCVTKEIMAEADPEDYLLTDDLERSEDIFFCDCEDHVGPRRIY